MKNNRNHLRRCLSAFLCFVFILTAVPLSGAAEEAEDIYTYTVQKGCAVITDCDDMVSGALTIPDTLGGYPVRQIGNSAFGLCETLASVTIPSGVTVIGDSAFANCYALASVSIPDTVTSIGTYAFNACFQLTTVTIPERVTKIGDGAFSDCRRLTAIRVDANNRSYISDSTGVLFNKDKTKLLQYPAGNSGTVYTIPDTVTEIGLSAFFGSKNLTAVTIPYGVTNIGSGAFQGCGALTAITIPDSVTNIADQTFSGCGSLKAVTLPDTVRTIGDHAFRGCGFAEIRLPDSLYRIGTGAFGSCEALTEIYIPAGVSLLDRPTTTYTSPFSGCSALREITVAAENLAYRSVCGVLYDKDMTELIHYPAGNSRRIFTVPDGVQTVRQLTFVGCTNLTGIVFPESMQKIRLPLLSSMPKLEFLHIPQFATSIFLGVVESKIRICADTADCYAKQYADQNALPFEVCGGTHSGTEDANIFTYTVADCEAIIKGCPKSFAGTIKIPDTLGGYPVTKIAVNAFKDCENLTGVSIPDTVRTIDSMAFSYCTNLREVTIPSGVTSIGFGVFSYCRSLTGIHVRADNLKYKSDSTGVLFSKDGTKLLQYPAGHPGTAYTVPDSVTGIDRYAFAVCENLTDISLPDRLRSIGLRAFDGCEALRSISIPNGVRQIPSGTFCACGSLSAVTLPDSLTVIGEEAFKGCGKLSAVDIPNGVTEIDKYAFEYCDSLSSVSLPQTLSNIGYGAFRDCSRLSKVCLSDGLQSISAYAFAMCPLLTEIYIPASVTRIGDPDLSAGTFFSGCENLEKITVSKGNPSYMSVDGVLFNKDGTELLRFPPSHPSGVYTIPDGVQTVHPSAFEGSVRLAGIVFPSGTRSVHLAISPTSNLQFLHIPQSVESIFLYAMSGVYTGEMPAVPTTLTICSDTAECYAGQYAEAHGLMFRVCDGHSAKPDADSIQGTCGEHVRWTLNKASGLLTVSGTGTMVFDETTAPWAPWKTNRTSIRSVVVESGITSIAHIAFTGCENLTTVSLPDTVEEIGCCAFQQCKNLQSITLPKGLTTLGNDAFYLCSALQSITVPTGNVNFKSKDGVLFSADEKTLLYYPAGNPRTAYTVPQSVSSLAPKAFAGNRLTALTLPDSLRTIGRYAFLCSAALTGIDLPNGVTTLGDEAFQQCAALTHVTLPNTLTAIGWSEFVHCTALQSVEIPASVTQIGTCAFTDCPALESFSVDMDNPAFCSVDGVLYSRDMTRLICYPGGSPRTFYTVPDGVQTLESWSMYDTGRLAELILPDSITTLSTHDVIKRQQLKTVHIPSSVQTIDSDFFHGGMQVCICSDKTDCYAKQYAEANGMAFRVCDGHSTVHEAVLHPDSTAEIGASYESGCFDTSVQLLTENVRPEDAGIDLRQFEFDVTPTSSTQLQVSSIYLIRAVDDTGAVVQPNEGHTVTLRFPIPNGVLPERCRIVHVTDVEKQYTESFRTKNGSMRVEDGWLVIEVASFSPFVICVEEPDTPVLSIIGNPGKAELRYGVPLVLKLRAQNLPDGAQIIWSLENEDILSMTVSESCMSCDLEAIRGGTANVTVKVLDRTGAVILTDTETVQVKVTFLDRIAAFLRTLFRLTYKKVQK